MTSVFRPNRKSNDEDLIKLNNLGLSLKYIAEQFNCHPSTVTQRLKELGIPVADTRRSFMEDIYKSLSPSQQEFLSEKLGASTSVKEFVRKLIVEEFVRSQ